MTVRQSLDQAFTSGLSIQPHELAITSRGTSNAISSSPSLRMEDANLQLPRYIDDVSHQAPKQNFISFRFPRRVFRWLYSISLFIFTILTVAFVAITPIDVIKQTVGTSSSGVKLFIVIIVCVVFLVACIVLYFSRLFQNRVSLNDIPSKSVYIPFYGDLPKDVCKHIDDKLVECLLFVKVKAGPLQNQNVTINHPGLAPPEYIQKRNKGSNGDGTLLPPNACYEDVIRSLGDKFRIDGRVITSMVVPKHFSFREVIISLTKLVIEEKKPKGFPDVEKLINLYEDFKFNKGLIKERDFLEFMMEFDKLAFFFQHNYDNELKTSVSTVNRKSFNSRSHSSDNGYDDLLQLNYPSRRFSSKSEFHPYTDDMLYSSSEMDENSDHSQEYYDNGNNGSSDAFDDKNPFQDRNSKHQASNSPYLNFEFTASNSSVINPMKLRHNIPHKVSSEESSANGNSDEPVAFWSGTGLNQFKLRNMSSASSTGSVVKRKLALSHDQDNDDSASIRRPSSGYLTDLEDENSQDYNDEEAPWLPSTNTPALSLGIDNSINEADQGYSHYNSVGDSERGRQNSSHYAQKLTRDENSSDDDDDYNFRRRRIHVPPILSSSRQSHQHHRRPDLGSKLSDIDIKRSRSKSPEKLIRSISPEKFRKFDKK